MATTISISTTTSTSRPSSARRIPVAGTPAVVVLSCARDGDVGARSRAPVELLEARRRSLAAGRWRWLHQCHGDGVVVLDPEESCEGREADALVSTVPGAPLAVFSADCALVGLASREGVVGAVHVGWRGLLAGVLERTAATMGSLGATGIAAVVGACIGPECYEFGEADLAPIEVRYGPSVSSRTSAGLPALDLRAGVHRALETAGVRVATDYARCTACDPGWFSWRARRDSGRHALVVVTAP
ncbi:MAG: polyphenol oxidase family protein [Acidimicrobiales bacterium]